jgi:Cys-rich protein (TIGR01571 family)
MFCFVCPEGSMGQVMQRLRLNWLGGKASSKTVRTFRVVAALAVVWWIVRFLSEWVSYKYTDDSGAWISNAFFTFFIVLTVLNLSFLVWSLIALTATRMHVREKYGIQGGLFQDCCCAFWCQCCAIAQLHRETGDYEKHHPVCCSVTGLPDGVEVV